MKSKITRVFKMSFDIAETDLTNEQDAKDLFKEIEYLIMNYNSINQEPLYFQSVGCFNIEDMSHAYGEQEIKELNGEINIDTLDRILYNGVEYPVRMFVVTHDNDNDDREYTYCIASEDLISAMRNEDDIDFEEDSIEERIDDSIYYYVEPKYFLLDAEEICKKHLDMPMTLVEEILF